jgi:single-strand DNA-binding protein
MLNETRIIGRVGKDPEMRYTATGIPVANFSVATTKIWKDQAGQKQEKTTWHYCEAWRKLAEITSEWVKKGMLIYAVGTYDFSEYEGRDGAKHKKTTLVVQDLKMLSKAGNGSGSGQKQQRDQRQGTPPQPDNFGDDDFIPEVDEDDVPL